MIKSALAAVALCVGLGVSAASAAPAPAPATLQTTVSGGVLQAHFTGDGHHLNGQVHRYRPRHYRNRHYRPHRAYRHHKRYRPRSGFSVELNFGSPRYRAPVASYSGRHHAWCSGKYRSYRSYDGTYQPYHGPRRRCNSPYDGI